MGYAILDGVYYGDRPFRSLGYEGELPSVLEVAAHARRPKVEIDHAELLAAGHRAYCRRLSVAAARQYAKHPELLNRVSWGLQFEPAGVVLAKADGELPSSVNRRGLRIYARWARRQERAARYAEAAE